MLFPSVINKKPKFDPDSEEMEREEEQYKQMAKLGKGVFSYTRMYFRKNVFEQNINWLWPTTKTKSFYDLKSDVENQWDGNKMDKGRRLITEYYYYRDINQLNHSLVVVNIEDFLGVIGGIFGLLFSIS